MKRDFGNNPLPEWTRGALVASRKNGDAAPALLERAGEDFHHGRLAGATDAEVANADDLAAEGVVAENPVVPEMQPGLNPDFIELGQAQQRRTGKPRRPITAPFKDDVEDVLLNVFSPLPHVQGIVPYREVRVKPTSLVPGQKASDG